ncbi:RDD family protein [Microbispora sp. RL4-1S]|uniref:RDD family protein n=1 Tax=Microbispora oryzae TaxID=2806554 RepID=A0A940WH91_9ACTN|nr:RDD family protein [Microbispora oryzae]MBP2705530.1 RDD family protein [Microbispora oryzae]
MVPHRLHEYPFPIAYPARLFEIADGPADRLGKAQHFLELVATFLGVLALAWCRENSVEPGGVKQWQRKLEPSGITLGAWNAAARAAGKLMARAERDPVARIVSAAAGAAADGLDRYGERRNVYAHGGMPRLRPDQEEAVAEMGRTVSALLDRVQPLTELRIGVIRSGRAGSDGYIVELDVMTGYAEPFQISRMRSSREFEKGTVVAYHDSTLDHAIDLSPYSIWHKCPECGRPELFYLHQRRKNRSSYLSFSTGHRLTMRKDVIADAGTSITALRLEPVGSTRSRASTGWRAIWADLAPRGRRISARTADLVIAVGVAVALARGGSLLGLTAWQATLAGFVTLNLYEPLSTLSGGSPGKRLARIEPISVWDARALNHADALRRALLFDLQFVFPPLAIRNLAWLIWDPARQCLHDRGARAIVVRGRSRLPQKR